MKPQPAKYLSSPAKRLFIDMRDEYDIDDKGGLRVLQTACEAWDRARACREQIDADGMLLVDRWGQRKPHPLLASERDARAQFLQAMKLLNLDVGKS